MRSAFYCALLALLWPSAGCVESDCSVFHGDQYEFFHGDRCPGLINKGELRLYPSGLVLPPSIMGADAASGVESSAPVSVRGWIDKAMTVPASGYVVDLILGSCTSPDVAAVEPATVELALEESDAASPACAMTNDRIARCILDSNGQASVRVVAGGTLSPASEDLCLWARSGVQDTKSEPREPTQESMVVRVGYGLDDLELKFEARLATPLGCGAAELPCQPIETPVLPATVCADGAACAELVQSVQMGISTRYQGILQASGEDLDVLVSLTSFGAGGRVWLSSSADCGGASATTLTVAIEGDAGRSPDVWICGDGLGGEVSIRAQSLNVPELADTAYARLQHVPSEVSAVSVVEGDIDAEGAVYRLFVRDCADQGLVGINVRGSLDGGQTFSALCTTDEVGACLLAMPKEMGTLPETLLARIDAWKTECALDIL